MVTISVDTKFEERLEALRIFARAWQLQPGEKLGLGEAMASRDREGDLTVAIAVAKANSLMAERPEGSPLPEKIWWETYEGKTVKICLPSGHTTQARLGITWTTHEGGSFEITYLLVEFSA